MSLVLLIVGIVLQAMFAMCQLITVIFAGGGAGSIAGIKPWQVKSLDRGILVLLAIWIIVSIVLVTLYASNSKYFSNWWHLIPVLFLVAYMTFVLFLTAKQSAYNDAHIDG